jgi:hypothetical protein
MKADEAYRIGVPGTPWCETCTRKMGMGEKQCGHPRPGVESFVAVSGERMEKCHCYVRDGRKFRKKKPVRQGRQADMFGLD